MLLCDIESLLRDDDNPLEVIVGSCDSCFYRLAGTREELQADGVCALYYQDAINWGRSLAPHRVAGLAAFLQCRDCNERSQFPTWSYRGRERRPHAVIDHRTPKSALVRVGRLFRLAEVTPVGRIYELSEVECPLKD